MVFFGKVYFLTFVENQNDMIQSHSLNRLFFLKLEVNPYHIERKLDSRFWMATFGSTCSVNGQYNLTCIFCNN